VGGEDGGGGAETRSKAMSATDAQKRRIEYGRGPWRETKCRSRSRAETGRIVAAEEPCWLMKGRQRCGESRARVERARKANPRATEMTQAARQRPTRGMGHETIRADAVRVLVRVVCGVCCRGCHGVILLPVLVVVVVDQADLSVPALLTAPVSSDGLGSVELRA